jgi:hypothetical protein
MKVPTKVLKAALALASNQPVSEEDRKAVLEWAQPAIDRRSQPRDVAAAPKED